MAPEITLEVQPLSLNSGYYPWALVSGAYNSGIIFFWIYDSSIQFTHQPSCLLSHVKLVHKTPHTIKWDLGGDVATHPPRSTLWETPQPYTRRKSKNKRHIGLQTIFLAAPKQPYVWFSSDSSGFDEGGPPFFVPMSLIWVVGYIDDLRKRRSLPRF